MSGFWLDARVYLGDWWGEDSGKPSETRKPARSGLFGVFRRLSETGLNSYMVPRRRLNWEVVAQYLLGIVGRVSVRHTRGHTWPFLLFVLLRLGGWLFHLGRTSFQLRLSDYAAGRTVKLE